MKGIHCITCGEHFKRELFVCSFCESIICKNCVNKPKKGGCVHSQAIEANRILYKNKDLNVCYFSPEIF